MAMPRGLHDIEGVRALEALGARLLGGDADALMARAGEAAWRCALDHWPDAQRIVVACGPGNNGGDGYVLARHALEAGRQVTVVRLPAHAPRSALATRACQRYLDAGGRIADTDEALADADLVVDALFGIGLARALDAGTTALVEAINAGPAPVLSLDVPSGVDAATGAVPGRAVGATRTVQFLAAHRGLSTGASLDHAGAREVAALGLDAAALESVAAAALAYGPDCLPAFLPARPRDSHKGGNGHVLCIGGDHGGGGAALLAAEGALRCGAGLVTVATRPAHVAAVLARRPELMVRAVEEPADVQGVLERASVIAVGPGLGQGAWSRGLLDAALARDVPRVLDADALNLLGPATGPLRACDVLTPHPGEAARLLGRTTAQVQADRFAAAAALCDRFGAQVVLKGAGTVVAAPDAVPAVIAAGNPGMAVGGMGDLLTGCIAALLAQGLRPRDAAVCGALLHASAGDAAAAADGERGLLPSDLLPWLRRLANPVRP